jgi:mono/diheme cytochrome c family protein
MHPEMSMTVSTTTRILVLSAALPAFFVSGQRLVAQEAGDVAHGRTIATTLCAACHLVGKGQFGLPGEVPPPFARIADTPGITTIALSAMLLTPHRQMPNIILQPDDRRDIVAYILSLK